MVAVGVHGRQVLRAALTKPLNDDGKDGIAKTMELMNAYGFSKCAPTQSGGSQTDLKLRLGNMSVGMGIRDTHTSTRRTSGIVNEPHVHLDPESVSRALSHRALVPLGSHTNAEGGG